jgi:hypothetical protein
MHCQGRQYGQLIPNQSVRLTAYDILDLLVGLVGRLLPFFATPAVRRQSNVRPSRLSPIASFSAGFALQHMILGCATLATRLVWNQNIGWEKTP